TASETKVGRPTLRVAEAAIEPEVAVMVALPTPAPVANPLSAMVAIAVEEEFQLTEAVRSCVLLSLYVPVAVNCCVVPFAIEAVAGVTEMETRIGVLTSTLAEPVTEPEVVMMVDVPSMLPVTSPAVDTGATAGAEDPQVTEALMSCI